MAAQEVSTLSALSAFRIGKLTERVAMLEKALVYDRATILAHSTRNGWVKPDDHYVTLAEQQLIYEGLVRPRNVREMEVRGNG